MTAPSPGRTAPAHTLPLTPGRRPPSPPAAFPERARNAHPRTPERSIAGTGGAPDDRPPPLRAVLLVGAGADVGQHDTSLGGDGS